jgi:CRP/FNR family transcriptional regulator, cyclic AMP receptor protein
MESEIFRNSALFEGLGDPELDKLLALFKRKAYPPLTTIFLENMPGNRLYVIERGLVKITKIREEFDTDREDEGTSDVPASLSHGVERVLVHLKSGEFFGEMSFIDGMPRSASAFSVEASEILVLEKSGFDRLAAEDSALAFRIAMNMAKILSGRLRQTDQLLVGLSDMINQYRT